MLRKKYVVQKSFRLDAQLSDDLELLSQLLKRPQNELYHMALERLMKDNEQWLLSNAIYEAFEISLMKNALDEVNVFEMQGLKVEWKRVSEEYKEDYVKFTMKSKTGAFDEVTYSDYNIEDIKACLRRWGLLLNLNDETKIYLKKRLEYR